MLDCQIYQYYFEFYYLSDNRELDRKKLSKIEMTRLRNRKSKAAEDKDPEDGGNNNS